MSTCLLRSATQGDAIEEITGTSPALDWNSAEYKRWTLSGNSVARFANTPISTTITDEMRLTVINTNGYSLVFPNSLYWLSETNFTNPTNLITFRWDGRRILAQTFPISIIITNLPAGLIVNSNIAANAAIDITKLADGSIDNTEFIYLNGLTNNIQIQINTLKNMTNKIYFSNAGVDFSYRPRLNFIGGTGVTFAGADNPGLDAADILATSYSAFYSNSVFRINRNGFNFIPGTNVNINIADNGGLGAGDITISTVGVIAGGITLTGDVTGTGTNTIATTISNGAVTDIKVASGINATKISSGIVNNQEFDTLDGSFTPIIGQLTNKVSKSGDTMTGTLVLNGGMTNNFVQALDIFQGWTNASVNFETVKITITNLASGATSYPLVIRVGDPPAITHYFRRDGTAYASLQVLANTSILQNGLLSLGADGPIGRASGADIYVNTVNLAIRSEDYVDMLLDTDNTGTGEYFRIARNSASFGGGQEVFRLDGHNARLFLRNNTNGALAKIFAAYTDLNNSSQILLDAQSDNNRLRFGSDAVGTGLQRPLDFLSGYGTAGTLETNKLWNLDTLNVTNTITLGNNLRFSGASRDIGNVSGTDSPSNIYATNAVRVNSSYLDSDDMFIGGNGFIGRDTWVNFFLNTNDITARTYRDMQIMLDGNSSQSAAKFRVASEHVTANFGKDLFIIDETGLGKFHQGTNSAELRIYGANTSINTNAYFTVNTKANIGRILLDSQQTSLTAYPIDLAVQGSIAATVASGQVVNFANQYTTNVATFNGFRKVLSTKTANYTTTENDNTILVDATSGNITITLIAAASHVNGIYVIKRIDSSVNTVTIDGNGAETIDGAANVMLVTQYSGKSIQSNGSNWFVIGSF